MGGADEREKAGAKDHEAPIDENVVAIANKALAERPEQLWLAFLSKHAWLLVPALVPVALIAGLIQGPAAAILVLVGAALISVIALFWSSVRTLLGETPLSGADAYAYAAPRREEEQKQAVLRALKDLEFERSVGKISDEDYSVLVAKYRLEAKRLLRALDDEAKPRRERVESLVHQRLVTAGLAEGDGSHGSEPAESPNQAGKGKKKKARTATKPAEKQPKEPPPRSVEITPVDEPQAAKVAVETTWKSELNVKTKESAAYVPSTKTCSECNTKNDPDAVFCKKCGSKAFGKSDGAKSEIDAKTAEETDDAKDEDEDASDETSEADVAEARR